MAQKVIVKCDGCGREGEPRAQDWATLRVPWRGSVITEQEYLAEEFDLCRGCVAKLMGWPG